MIAMNCVVMFTDLHEFSIVARNLGDRGFEFINDVFVSQGDAVVEAHGTIIKYMGDALLAVFPDKNEAVAVRCAMRMREDFRDLVDRWSISHDTDLEIGLGWGRILRGTIGHSSQLVDDIYGEEVENTAVICHHRGVAVTESMYERVKDDFEFSPMPKRTVKWRDRPLGVWALIEE